MTSALFVTTVPITLEAFLVPFADHFRARGWHIDALANGATANEHIETHFDRRFDVAWSRNPLSPGNLVGTAGRVRDIVAQGGYDVVHVHTPIAAFVTRYALRHRPRGTRPALIYTAHGFHFYTGQPALPHAAFRTMERIAAPWTDYLVTINAEDFSAAQGLGGIAAERVRLIPGIGVDTVRFAPDTVAPADAERVRDELGVREGNFMLTMVAEFAPPKRHALALDALSRVSDPRVVLVLAGDGPLAERIRADVAARGLTERVRFAGYRRDVPQLLAASDALLLCSEREGLNRSALEAMASGVPVIGTRTRGIADAIGGPDAGWIAEPGDPASLAAAIARAASDPDALAARGHAARERAVAVFSLDHVIADYEELYREALASRV